MSNAGTEMNLKLGEVWIVEVEGQSEWGAVDLSSEADALAVAKRMSGFANAKFRAARYFRASPRSENYRYP